jgi:hypothetical protein
VKLMSEFLTAFAQVAADYQAERAADAAWETARWTWWLVFATFLLFMGAVAAAIYARHSWSAANGQLKMMRAAQERQDATNVSAWLHQSREGGLMEIRLRNGNPAPVHDVKYKVAGRMLAEGAPKTREFRNLPEAVLPPSPEIGYTMVHQISGDEFLPGGKNSFFASRKDWKPWNGGKAEAGVVVDLSFRDSKGVRWQRDGLGTLSKE